MLLLTITNIPTLLQTDNEILQKNTDIPTVLLTITDIPMPGKSSET